MMGPYPMFSLYPLQATPTLTFYGEEIYEEPIEIEMNQEVVEVQQAINNVLQEVKHIQTYNRFKDLQKRYGKKFLYH